jgi:hypothetical protein
MMFFNNLPEHIWVQGPTRMEEWRNFINDLGDSCVDTRPAAAANSLSNWIGGQTVAYRSYKAPK